VTRDALLKRWTTLTRETLPAMAPAHAWPISLDHCFMRVCLDAALGARWDTRVRRPAMRHLSDLQLAHAVAIAEHIVGDPDALVSLNRRSLAYRMKSGAAGPSIGPLRAGAKETRSRAEPLPF
jgi:hypothetical protein